MGVRKLTSEEEQKMKAWKEKMNKWGQDMQIWGAQLGPRIEQQVQASLAKSFGPGFPFNHGGQRSFYQP